MASIETRPVDDFTIDNVLIGMPFVEFGAADGVGGFGAYRNLGIVDAASVEKVVEVISLKTAQSGTDKLVREVVRSLEARLIVSIFNFNPENMQLFFASSTLTAISGGTTAVVDEVVTLGVDVFTWADLANLGLTVFTDADPAQITDEIVGVGDGTLGDGVGDYALDFKPNDVAEVTSITVAGVAYTPVGLTLASTGLEVEVTDYVDDTTNAGDLQFHSAGVPVNVTGEILATYKPLHTLTENTDYAVDYADGRIRPLAIGATDKLKASQPLEVDYTYTSFTGQQVKPFTQLTFTGRARLRLLTDIGINIIWNIPSVTVRLTDTAFAFSREEFGTGEVSITLQDDGTATPFGTMDVYDENAA